MSLVRLVNERTLDLQNKTNTPPKLLILEDDPGTHFVYQEVLGLRYEIEIVESIASLSTRLHGLDSSRSWLLIADLRLPDGSFLSVLKSDLFSKIPPYVVISSAEDLDILRDCYRLGAIDYLTKPFRKGELLAKIEKALHQIQENKSSVKKPATIDPSTLRVVCEGKTSQPLTAKELQILTLLLNEYPKPQARDFLLEKVWEGVRVDPKTLDVHLSHIRSKIKSLHLELEVKENGWVYLIRTA